MHPSPTQRIPAQHNDFIDWVRFTAVPCRMFIVDSLAHGHGHECRNGILKIRYQATDSEYHLLVYTARTANRRMLMDKLWCHRARFAVYYITTLKCAILRSCCLPASLHRRRHLILLYTLLCSHRFIFWLNHRANSRAERCVALLCLCMDGTTQKATAQSETSARLSSRSIYVHLNR